MFIGRVGLRPIHILLLWGSSLAKIENLLPSVAPAAF